MTANPLPTQLDSTPTQGGSGAQDETSAEPVSANQLYHHSKRRSWGLALRVQERDGRYDFQFEDGQMRTIAPDFMHLLVAVDRPADETGIVLRNLTAMSGMAIARSERESDSGTRAITLDEQVAWFVDQYADGFVDEQWEKKNRGIGAAKRAKAHREAAIAQARKLLAVDQLDRLLEQLRGDEIVERALTVMKGTSLVSAAQMRPLEELDPRRHGLFGQALRDLLYGDQDLELRFVRLIQVFSSPGTPLSWSAATLWLALVHPSEHVCVRPNVFAEQARWMAPLLRLPSKPAGRCYLRLRDMALTLRDELEQRDLGARDLLDVYDFIWFTLRPAARKAILARPPAPRASGVQLTEGAAQEQADKEPTALSKTADVA
jgi:hypothetical protein